MKKLKELHELIHGMNKAEKRHFKLYNKYRPKQKTNTEQLFDLLDKHKAYDDKRLLPKIKKMGIATSLQNYLYDQILHSLSDFHIKNEKKLITLHWIMQASILAKKDLHYQAHRILQKAQKTCEEYEYTYLGILVNIEMYILENKYPLVEDIKNSKTRNKLKKLLNDGTSIIDLEYKCNSEFLKYWDRIILDNDPTAKKELTASMEEINTISPTNNIKVQLYKNACYATYYQIMKDPEKSIFYMRATIDLLEQRIANKQHVSTIQYATSIINMAQMLQEQKKMKESLPFLEKAFQYTQQKLTGDRKIVAAFMLIFHKISAYAHLQNWQALYDSSQEVKQKYLHLAKPEYVDTLIQIYYHTTYAAFVLQKYEEVIFWTTQLETLGHTDIFVNLFFFGKTLHLLSHYELGNYQLVENLSKRYVRQVPKTLDINLKRYFRCFFNFAYKHLFYQPSKSVLKPHIIAFQQKINNFIPHDDIDALGLKLHLQLTNQWCQEKLGNTQV